MRKPIDLHMNSSKCFPALREIGAKIRREVQEMLAKRYTIHFTRRNLKLPNHLRHHFRASNHLKSN